MSPEELRKKVLLNLINLQIKNAIEYDSFQKDARNRVGIINSASELDHMILLERVYNGEGTIEDILGLDMLVDGRKDGRKYVKPKLYLEEQIVEPFILLTYSKVNSAEVGGGYISPNIRAEPCLSNEPKRVGVNESFKGKSVFLLNALRGYNNHYYRIQRFSFERECSDIRLPEKFLSKDLMPESCKEKNRAAFLKQIKPVKKFSGPKIAAISNCGDILTKPHDMGLPIHSIDWVRPDRIR